jgi:hypothetical protein
LSPIELYSEFGVSRVFCEVDMDFLCEEGTWEYEGIVIEGDFFAAIPASESDSIHRIIDLNTLN